MEKKVLQCVGIQYLLELYLWAENLTWDPGYFDACVEADIHFEFFGPAGSLQEDVLDLEVD